MKRAAVQASVLRATEELLAEGARYGDLAVERIATRAGISRTAFYFYFRDKRELLMRLTENLTTLFYGQAEIWFSGDAEPERELRTAIGDIAAAYREHAPLVRAVIEVSGSDPEVAAHWRTLIGRFVEASTIRIEAEQAAGRAPGGAAHARSFALVWMTERTLYQQIVDDTGHTDEELLDALVGVWITSVYGRI